MTEKYNVGYNSPKVMIETPTLMNGGLTSETVHMHPQAQYIVFDILYVSSRERDTDSTGTGYGIVFWPTVVWVSLSVYKLFGAPVGD